jgi:hypothetical protein
VPQDERLAAFRQRPVPLVRAGQDSDENEVGVGRDVVHGHVDAGGLERGDEVAEEAVGGVGDEVGEFH